eukprot:1706129-Rhodomonas_salina.4
MFSATRQYSRWSACSSLVRSKARYTSALCQVCAYAMPGTEIAYKVASGNADPATRVLCGAGTNLAYEQ